MENTNQPSPPDESNEAVRALEARLDALEQGIAEGASAEGRPFDQAELSAELARHRDQLRDHEKALVERIADVDDDRRATASRLQRAWQSQREEIDERLRRHAALIAGLLILFAVLFVVALFLVYRQATVAQAELAAEVTELRQELAGISKDGAVDAQVHGELDRAASQIEEITSSLGKLTREREQAVQASVAAASAAPEAGEPPLAEEIRRLGAEQEQLSGAVGSLKSALGDLKASLAKELGDVSSVAAMSAAPPTTPVPEPDADAAGVTPATAEDPSQETDQSASDTSGESRPGEVQGGAMEAAGEGQPDETDVSPPDAPEGGSSEAPGEDALGSEASVPSVAEPGESNGPAAGDSGASEPGLEETLLVAEGKYALQLISYASPESRASFLTRIGLPERVYAMRETDKDRSLYVVIHSLHDDYAAAEEALSRLPPDLVGLSPWIRALPEGTELRIVKTGSKQE